MRLTELDSRYSASAAELFREAYLHEREACAELPDEDFSAEIEGCVGWLVSNGAGAMAFDGDELIGYLAFFQPFDGMFGNCKGVFSPFHGCAVSYKQKERDKIASMLFAFASEKLVAQNVTSYAASLPAHDTQLHRSFALNGFGIRCADGIRRLSRPLHAEKPADISCRELGKNEWQKVLRLRAMLTRHLAKAPAFFPTGSDFYDMNRFEKRGTRIFVAEKSGEILGFIEVGAEGETFVTESENMRSICGAYFEEEARGSGASAYLLSYIISTLSSEGWKYLGVDCETLNPTALRFWGKHFENYTYSFHRRVDERVIGYDEYISAVETGFIASASALCGKP